MNKTFRSSSISVALCASLSSVVLLVSVIGSTSSYAQTTSQHQDYQIAAGSLAAVLNQFVQQSGVRIAVDAEQLQGLSSRGLSGEYAIDDGFAEILAGSGYAAQGSTVGYVLVKDLSTAANRKKGKLQTEQDPVQLVPIVVYGEKDRDTKGYDDVYDKNYSSVYAGKDLIERFKGTTPSDLFTGMSNVYSGDARNSGALDPNIRGMQGQGRVPVTIDGTEQSLTVWRGYGGANSRSYIDPNLISSLQVVKGAALNSEIKTGIAGGVAAKTLEVDDIVRPGARFGMEIKVEGANNSVTERVPVSYTGQDYRDVMDSLGMTTWASSVLSDPLTMIEPKTSSDNDFDDLQDRAFRIAIATKQDSFDLLAAYAYRNRGNYYAGKEGSDFFVNNGTRRDISSSTGLVPYMATAYVPGGEVTNSSSWMESYLFKGTWRPTESQVLQLTYRDSLNKYGELVIPPLLNERISRKS